MNKEVEQKLLNSKTIDEFQAISAEHGLKEFSEYSEAALKHFNSLFPKSLDENMSHEDPLPNKIKHSS